MISLFTIEKYSHTVKGSLQRSSEELIQQIRKTLDFNYYDQIDLLDYTAFIQPYEISIVMYSMDRNANEVFYQGSESNIFAGSYDLIEDVEYFNLLDDQEGEFWAFYEQHEEEISKIETQIMVDWFKDCWKRAGGERVKLQSYFSFHDYDHCFDLQNNQWITDGDKWLD
ncbi:hypothetical protein P4T04_02040 [Bacillus badius]|uniref:hypothetical protein n=1 Tax=Bacillus badius TaxID=1455 RepID=UPI002E1E447F|nr:hypothetical protein [Bacillus badius]